MKKTVLLMTQDSIKRKEILSLCKTLDIELKEIRPENINTPIGGMLGMPISIKPSKVAPALFNSPELMMFNGLNDKELDIFLDEYKSKNIKPILYKGAITPYNITWSPYELMLEYEKEQM